MIELSNKNSKTFPKLCNESSEEELAAGTAGGGGSRARRLYISVRKKKRKERERILLKDKRSKNFESESEALSLPNFKVAIVGSEGVGKSAIAVRHITNRFIGEYRPGEETYYCKDNKMLISYEVLVQCSSISQAKLSSLRLTTNGFLIVYDITSRDSFNYAAKLVETLRNPGKFILTAEYPAQRAPKRYFRAPQNSTSEDDVFYENEPPISPRKHRKGLEGFNYLSIPILLIGNKRDMEHRREVSVEEAQNVALENNCNFLEISAAESAIGPNLAIKMILKEISLVHKENSEVYQTEYKDHGNIDVNPGSSPYSNTRRNDSDEIKYHFKEYSLESSISSRSSSCSSHKSSSNYSSCSSNWRNFKTSSLKGSLKFKDWNGQQEPKGIFSDMKITLENLFYGNVYRKSGRKSTHV